VAERHGALPDDESEHDAERLGSGAHPTLVFHGLRAGVKPLVLS
jgi:hypothetical protein